MSEELILNTNSGPIFKVDGIANVEEVALFRGLSIHILGISVDDAGDLERARHIVADDFSDVCYRFDLREIAEAECVNLCQLQPPSTVDFVGHFLPKKETCTELLKEGIRLFFSNVEASYDTDPSWILSRHEELLELENTFFQIDLLEQTEDAWRILREVVSEDRDELTIADIDILTKQRGVFLNLNFTPSNLAEILQILPNVRGVSFSLEQSDFRRWYTAQQVEGIVDHIA